jgi:hypothetical protein
MKSSRASSVGSGTGYWLDSRVSISGKEATYFSLLNSVQTGYPIQWVPVGEFFPSHL